MTTRAELRARIRAELNDAGAVPLWGNGQLDQWITEGLRALARDGVGLEKATTLASVAEQASYALPADVVEVLRVEHPAGFFRKPVPFAAGDVAPEAELFPSDAGLRPGELLYDVYGGQLVLSPAPDGSGEAIVVRYVGAYAEPSGDGSVLDVAARDEDALVLWACARALRWIGLDESKRQRFERQRGASPAFLQGEYDRQYRRIVSQRRSRRPRRLAIR